MGNDANKLNKNPLETDGLLHALRGLIQDARQKALRAVDAVQVQTCWEIGRQIVEFEQRGATRAEYGARLLPNEHIFASRYKLVLPSQEELRIELDRKRAQLASGSESRKGSG